MRNPYFVDVRMTEGDIFHSQNDKDVVKIHSFEFQESLAKSMQNLNSITELPSGLSNYFQVVDS